MLQSIPLDVSNHPSRLNQRFVIIGKTTTSDDDFVQISLMAGEDIAYHLSIRFDTNEVVRNVLTNGEWHQEHKGKPFAHSVIEDYNYWDGSLPDPGS